MKRRKTQDRLGRSRSAGQPTPEDYRALAAFRYHLRSYLVFADQSARAKRLSPSQYLALLALKGAPRDLKPTVGYVAAHLQVRHHSAVGLIDRMASRGLVRRRSGVSDQREVLVTLTPRGARVLRGVVARNLAELRSSHPGLTSVLNALLRYGVRAPDAALKRNTSFQN